MAGLGYDAYTRNYAEQMGRMGQARGQFWGPIRRLQGVGRVADRFLLGPGNNMTPSLQAARAGRSRMFRNRLGLALGAGTLAAGALGGMAVGAPGMAIRGAKNMSEAASNSLVDPNGFVQRMDPLGLFSPKDVNFEGNYAQQGWGQWANSLFRGRGYQGPDRAYQTGVATDMFTPETSRELASTRPARENNIAVAQANSTLQGLGRFGGINIPTLPTPGRRPAPAPAAPPAAVQTGVADMGTERPAGFQGAGRPLQTGEMDMNVQYPVGYQGPGRALQTGTQTIGRGWLGSLSPSGSVSAPGGRQFIS